MVRSYRGRGFGLVETTNATQKGSLSQGSQRLAQVFTDCRAEKRSALIGYLPSGYPTVDEAGDVFDVIATHGCDVVEVGISYSDPMMDGPTIQAATAQALKNGVRTRDVFPLIERISANAVPVVMSYWNPVLQYGIDAFARDLANAGGAGIITPDLIPEEADEWRAAADRYGLNCIFLVAPSSTPERLRKTVDASSGFVYAASVMGVTGARSAVSDEAPALVQRVRDYSDIPVGVGLGVRNRQQASELAGYADGVIVGSALVSEVENGLNSLAALTEELALGVREPRA